MFYASMMIALKFREITRVDFLHFVCFLPSFVARVYSDKINLPQNCDTSHIQPGASHVKLLWYCFLEVWEGEISMGFGADGRVRLGAAVIFLFSFVAQQILFPRCIQRLNRITTGQQSTSFHYKPRAEKFKVGLTNKQSTRLLLREAIQTSYFWWFISMERPNFWKQRFTFLIFQTELQFRCCTGHLFNSSQSCDLNAI